MSQTQNIVGLNFLNFPLKLLIPDQDFQLNFQIINNSPNSELYQIIINEENIDIIQSEDFAKGVQFKAKETKQFQIKLRSKVNGQGKLIFNINHLKTVKYIVKVQKIREVVSISKINEIFGKEYITSTDMEDLFFKDEYIVNMSENEIQEALSKLDLPDEPPVGSEYGEDSQPPSFPVEQKQLLIKKIAKAYFTKKELLKAFRIIERLSDDNQRWDLYSDLVRAYAFINIGEAIKYANVIPNKERKENLLKNIALDVVLTDAEQASQIALLIDDPKLKETLLSEILFKCIRSNPLLAIEISNLIEDLTLRILVLFEICSALLDQNNKPKVLELIQKILTTLLSTKTINLAENKFNNFNYHLFLNSVHALAELDSPKAADAYIKSLKVKKLRKHISKDLFDILYKMVDETRTKIDSKVVLNQYYLINTYASRVFEGLSNFTNMDGNISENVLSNNFNFKVLLFCLFGYSFNIFPFIDRIYKELKGENNILSAYYIYPVKGKYRENDTLTIKKTIEHFFKSNFSQMSGNTYIFNLDFIPYLNTPTIIMESDPSIKNLIQSKINNILRNKISLILDDGVFKGGDLSEFLKSIFPINRFKILNLALSYEILNDYILFKDFIKALIYKS